MCIRNGLGAQVLVSGVSSAQYSGAVTMGSEISMVIQ